MSFCILKQWRLAYPNSGKGVSSSHCLSSRFHMPTPRRSRSPGPYLSQKYSQRYKEFHPLDIISELISQYLIIFNIYLQCDSLRMCRNFSCSGCENLKPPGCPDGFFIKIRRCGSFQSLHGPEGRTDSIGSSPEGSLAITSLLSSRPESNRRKPSRGTGYG